ncbi:MAG: hypothetical protein B9S32_15255 [Verrucomicrobia bacterium Tous-C9LFEB]|nr:MAG: hypothetical protein B9S32_15255 [Verrucomicrobia bacterium Tous-C9LFEB]
MEKQPLPDKQFRLKKGEDESIFGPVNATTLKEWAESAQVAPIDFVDETDEQWKPAPSIEFLEMVYEVKFPDGTSYGPTTVGTLRELLKESIITEDASVNHLVKKHSSPLGAVIAAADFEPKPRRETPAPPPQPVETNGTPIVAHPAVEMAKDQRIRQLEEDLRILRKEHDELLQKYRKLNQQLVEAKAVKK